MVRPHRLCEGDLIAAVSPSWGGPSIFPDVFDLGLRNLTELFGVWIREYPTTRLDNAELHRNPQARAEDLNAAFADPEVKAIFASIGGDDSIRILPYLDLDLIRSNPKIVMGFSDTATILTLLNHQGLVTFNGPSIMAGFGQMHRHEIAFGRHVKTILTDPAASIEYRPFAAWTDQSVPWESPGYDGSVVGLRPHDGWRWLQGSGIHVGRLFGGCIEVVAWLKGTPFWPERSFWDNRILFLETSEDMPTPDEIGFDLRNYGAMGVLDRISGILFGRARGYSHAQKEESYRIMVRVVAEEYGRADLPIVANLDFGHTDPQWVMPLGVEIAIDCERRTLRLTEPAVD